LFKIMGIKQHQTIPKATMVVVRVRSITAVGGTCLLTQCGFQ